MNYAAGFSQGEKDAYQDRLNGVRRDFSEARLGEWHQGYRDGYSPRNPEWSARQPKAGAAWWVEREAACD